MICIVYASYYPQLYGCICVKTEAVLCEFHQISKVEVWVHNNVRDIEYVVPFVRNGVIMAVFVTHCNLVDSHNIPIIMKIILKPRIRNCHDILCTKCRRYI